MQNFLKILSCGILVQAATLTCSSAAEYPEPDISSIMFHVDKLPLDHDRVKSVSRDLTILASINAKGNAAKLQANARLLAIAMRLDSKNEVARKLNQKLINNTFIVEPGGDEYSKATVRISRLIKGLSKAEKYNEAHTLLDYVKDAMKQITPNDPVIKAHQVMPQRWENVVPPIAEDPPVKTLERKGLTEDKSSQDSQIPDKKDPTPPVAKLNSDGHQAPKIDGNKPSPVASWHQLASKVSSPIYMVYKVGEKRRYTLEQSKFKLSITPLSEEENVIEFHVSPEAENDDSKHVKNKIKEYLDHKWKSYSGVDIKLKLSGIYSKKSGSAGVFPILLQLEASLKNVTLKGGVTVLGNVNKRGGIHPGHLFWRQLHVLREQSQLQQTLICPLAAEPYLHQLVALEDAEFFVRNEVILVKDMDEAVKFASKLQEGDLSVAHEEFVKIRDLVGSRSVGSYSVDKKIRAKLENILKLNPNHMSAKMILLRGDSKRSGKLESFFVAEEFKPLVKSLEYVVEKDNPEDLKSEDMKRRSDRLDEAIKAMTRYIDSGDKVMSKALENMADELNNMSRALEKNDSDYHKRSLRVAYERFKKDYKIAVAYIKEKQEADE